MLPVISYAYSPSSTSTSTSTHASNVFIDAFGEFCEIGKTKVMSKHETSLLSFVVGGK